MGHVHHQSFHVHPGVWVMREIVEAYGLTVEHCARQLRIETRALQSLLEGNLRLSPTVAVRLQDAFGIKAETLLAMQYGFDRMQERLRAEWEREGRKPAYR